MERFKLLMSLCIHQSSIVPDTNHIIYVTVMYVLKRITFIKGTVTYSNVMQDWSASVFRICKGAWQKHSSIKNRIERDRKNCPQSVTIKSDRLINLNTAKKEELDTLPGISGKLAEKIIAARQQKPFTSLEDLDRVSGIGQGKINKLKGKVSWWWLPRLYFLPWVHLIFVNLLSWDF